MSLRSMKRQLAKKQQKEVNDFKRMSLIEKQAALSRNGITPKYLEEKCNQFYKNGYTDGVNNGTQMMMETCYEAFILALHQKYGFGPDRCMEVLSITNSYIVQLTDDLENAVALKCKMRFDFSDPTNPVVQKMTAEQYKEFREKLNGNKQAD